MNSSINLLNLRISVIVDPLLMWRSKGVPQSSKTISLKINACLSGGIPSCHSSLAFTLPTVSEGLTLKLMVVPVGAVTNISINPLDLRITMKVDSFWICKLARI